MARLITCNMCGRQVSEDASTCPHCQGNPHYHPHPCWVCDQPVVNPKATSFYIGSSFHEHCLTSYRNKPEIAQFSCPACKKNYRYDSFSKSSELCSHCGHPLKLASCSLCNGLVLIGQSEIVTSVEADGYSYSHGYYHKPCKKIFDKLAKKYAYTNKDCFIATACYGSLYSSELILFRQFRNEILLTSRVGSGFVRIYYKTSPTIARIISKNIVIRLFVKRLILTPILSLIKSSGLLARKRL